MKKTLLYLAAFAIFISSCSVEKRLHTDGYHIEWYSNNKSKVQHQEPVVSPESSALALTQPNATDVTTESAEVEMNIPSAPAMELTSPEIASDLQEKKQLDRKAMRQAIKEIRKEVKQQQHSTSPMQIFSGKASPAGVELTNPDQPDKVLLIVLAFFLPPLAVYLYEGEWTKRCTTNLILTLLCGLPGLIHALIVILEK